MKPSGSTTKILNDLRLIMKNKSYDINVLSAYIIPSGDAHQETLMNTAGLGPSTSAITFEQVQIRYSRKVQSEYIAPCDKRREFISNFTGSLGTAIVTNKKAALWTDGRYYIQAAKELDANWTLMKQGLLTTPSESKWLSQELPEGSFVGVDPFLYDAQQWGDLTRELSVYSLSLVPVYQNLIDVIWAGRPPAPSSIVYPLEIHYTGQSIDEKIEVIRGKLREEGATALILTALDDIAYTFNLRGSDIECNPVFISYSIITLETVHLYINESKLTEAAAHHLSAGDVKVRVRPYEEVSADIDKLVSETTGPIWVSNRCSYAIHEKIPGTRRISKVSPVAVMKAVKNETERKGMRACHVRDGAALCRYLCWLEREVAKGEQTEVSAANVLAQLRGEQEHFVDLSFETISASGPNAAVVHYRPAPETDRKITTEEIYLVDSGGQYRDGTTDVTRTVHFGTPSEFEKESFSRVLKGHIAMSSCKFPSKIKGNRLDILARKFLWDVGLDYGHGTGHGVGMFLNVHEGPMGISWRPNPDDCGLEEGMFLSDEPGYYEDGKFGIRIENIVEIVKAETPHNKDREFLTFETTTLAPIQTKMICPSMLTAQEVQWLNGYHAKVLETVGALLLKQGHKDAYNWLAKETRPIG